MGRLFVLIAAVTVLAVGCSSTTTKQDAAPATGGSGGESGSNPDDLCGTYCETIEAHCTGEYEQFVSRATCLAFCDLVPPGNGGDEIGNSVQCRLRQATVAGEVAEPDQHCAEAGPGGNGTCGSNCESYCNALEQVCGARFDDEFVGRADCNAQCGELPDEVRFGTSIDSGNSIQCRLWHVSAASIDASTHCGHAVGEDPCVAPTGS